MSKSVGARIPVKGEFGWVLSRTESGGTEVKIIERNYTPFWSKVQRRRRMYLAMIERRLQ